MTTPIVDPAVADPAAPAAVVEPPAAKPEELSAEVLRAKLTEANAEAANYRVRAREAEEKLKSAKTPEEFAAATAEFAKQNAALAKEILHRDIATEHKLPADLASALRGETKEELEAHAKILAKYVPAEIEVITPPATLSGGLTPNDDGVTETNPGELARKYGGRRR